MNGARDEGIFIRDRMIRANGNPSYIWSMCERKLLGLGEVTKTKEICC